MHPVNALEEALACIRTMGARSAFSNAIPKQKPMEASTMNHVAKFAVLASCLTFAGATFTFA